MRRFGGKGQGDAHVPLVELSAKKWRKSNAIGGFVDYVRERRMKGAGRDLRKGERV